MSFHRWLRNLRSALEASRTAVARRPQRPNHAGAARPRLESLDERSTPAFLAPVGYDTGDYPQSMVAADFNNDGQLDLATSDSNTVSVLLGNADGTFQQAKTSAAYSSIAVGDFDQDGIPDLATAGGDQLLVLMGDGMGHFEAPTSIDYVGYGATSVAVGDFNGDGLMDLGVVSGGYDGGYYAIASIHAGDGQGHFAEPNTTFINYNGFYSSATTVDLDGDGVDDLAATNNVNGWSWGSVVLLRGDVSGYFQSTLLFTGDNEYDVAVGDVNGDNVADVVTANGYHSSKGVSVLLGNGLGGYGAAQTYAVGTTPYDLVLGDFTGDGRIDIATAGDYALSILRGLGDGTFSEPEFFVGPSGSVITAGDFNGDGWLDVATTAGANSVSVLINDQSWQATPPPPPPSVSISDAMVTEGNTGTVNATFTVTLSKVSDVDVTVHYDTANSSAVAGSDYTAASGIVTIPAGQTSATFIVAVIGDRLFEPTETFVVYLSAATNALVPDAWGVGTILDDEPRISIDNVSRKEGGTGKTTVFTFTVSLSAAYDQVVTVNYATADGTATAGSDYESKTGTVTFAPGETSKTITVVVKGDKLKESNETFFVDLFGASGNALLLDAQGIGTILDDDNHP